MRLDLAINVKTDPEVVSQAKQRGAGGSVVDFAADWLVRARTHYDAHELEMSMSCLNNAVAVAQIDLIARADSSGRIYRSAPGTSPLPTPPGPPGRDSEHSLGCLEVLRDAFFWRAACQRGIGAVEDAISDLDRLLEWHYDVTGSDSGQRLRTAELHAFRALCLFEGMRVQEALDDACRAVGLAPDLKEPQRLLAELSRYAADALGQDAPPPTVPLRYIRVRGHQVFKELSGGSSSSHVLFEIGVRLPGLLAATNASLSAASGVEQEEIFLLKRFSEVLAMHDEVKAAVKKLGQSRMPAPPSRMMGTKFMRGKFDPDVLMQRTAQLQHYFDVLLAEGLDELPECLSFFSPH